jgi:Asp-tRNA(Asn)/Glu-tRNA(Gln) amidotransferase A subunit family amidase
MADDGLVTLTASEAAAEIARGAVSAETYARACLARIEALDGEVRAFAHLDGEHVLAQARMLDERRMLGHPLGPLHGIPVAIKDIIDTADYPTELGSPLAAGRRPRHDPGRHATRTITPVRPAVRPRDRRRRSPPIWCRSRSAARPTGR